MDSGLKQSCPVAEAMLLLTFCQRREEIWGALSWWSGPILQEAARSPHPGTHQYRPGGPVCPSPYRQCHGRPEERQRATRQWSVRKTCQSMVCVTGQWPVSTATQMQHLSQVNRRRIHVLYLFSLTTRLCFFLKSGICKNKNNTFWCIWRVVCADLIWHQRGDGSANLMIRLGLAFGPKQDE